MRLHRPLRGFIRLRQHNVRAENDLIRGGLPAMARTLVAIISSRLPHHFERPVRNAEADMGACCELAGFAAGAECVGRWMRNLRRARPDGHCAILEMPALPAERLRLGPRLEDQLHPLLGAVPRLLWIEGISQCFLAR